MYYRREGYPEEGELVLCTVTNVQYHSVFCKLDEYDKSGLIHISEVSPGRIRNIRDYVVEGKKVICKVLRVNEERGHIDLSLRRVTESEKRKKNEEIKQELKAEKIIENMAVELGRKPEEIYPIIAKPILSDYEYLHEAFQEYVDEEADLDHYDIPAELLEKLKKQIKEKIKPRRVIIKGEVKATTYAENGIEVIKEALISAEKTVDKNDKNKSIKITYLGNATYKLVVEADDYKTAEDVMERAVDKIREKIEATKGVVEYKKLE